MADVDGARRPDILLADKRQFVWFLLGRGADQIVVGRRGNRPGNRVGIKLFLPLDDTGTAWKSFPVDENQMACEDLCLANLDGDGRPDIVASGRSTRNLKVYFNRTGVSGS